jgi:triosephosphate isomerase
VIGEDDDLVRRKLRAALNAELNAVLCVGETLAERSLGRTEDVVFGQLQSALAGVPDEQMHRVVIAYEPVWAVGTGRIASPADAQAVHQGIRRLLARAYDDRLADAARIQYGGSLKASNAPEMFAAADVDGGLVGGASLNAEEFHGIVLAALQAGRACQARQQADPRPRA